MPTSMSHDEFWENLEQVDLSSIGDVEKFLLGSNRSSTIFPIFSDESTKTSIRFLSYWLKKHGNNVIMRYSIRDLEGQSVNIFYEAVASCKAYTTSVSDFFSEKNGFCGSVEIEVFSKDPPYYTFPALTVCYERNESCSVVHSCIRTYNKGEVVNDYAIMLPQTGFDVDFKVNNKNFICFIGGNAKIYTLDISLVEGEHQKKYQLKLKNNCYGETHVIWLEDIVPKRDILLFANPKCIIKHDLADVFPRFYVGIKQMDCAPTMTHTFFDTSTAEEVDKSEDINFRAINTNPANYFDSAFSIPILSPDAYETVLRSYGQNLGFYGAAVVSIHSVSGELIYSRSFTQTEMELLCGEGSFEVHKMLEEAKVKLGDNYCARFTFCDEKIPFPRRFKLGLNVKRKGRTHGSNICFAPMVIAENTINKPFNRRWFPVGGKQNFVATFHNTDLKKLSTIEITSCNFEFFNHKGESISRTTELVKNESVLIDVQKDEQLSSFLGNDGGWCMVNSNTYLCDAYFFALAGDQVGGDHAY